MIDTEFCEKNPYLIPQLYIKDLSSEEYLVKTGSNTYKRSKNCAEGRECYGKSIYGIALDEVVDLVSKRARRAFVVVLPPQYKLGILIKENSYIEPIPVEGMRTHVAVCEGSKIDVGDTIGYTSTRKHEFRRVKSHVSGVVVYVYSSPESRPEKNIIFIAPKEAVSLVSIQ